MSLSIVEFKIAKCCPDIENTLRQYPYIRIKNQKLYVAYSYWDEKEMELVKCPKCGKKIIIYQNV